MKSILAFIIVFGLVVFVHEFGHFFVAKKAGILVREFSIGMGPKVFNRHGAKIGSVAAWSNDLYHPLAAAGRLCPPGWS